jgi:hypothetical protein
MTIAPLPPRPPHRDRIRPTPAPRPRRHVAPVTTPPHRRTLPRYSMTVCIAAILQGNTIAFVTDQMVSNEFIAAEGFRKHYHLDSELRWLAMCEAKDARRVPALMEAIQRDLGPGIKSFQEVDIACTSAYRSELEKMCDAKLSRRGFTLRSFIDQGHEKLGDGLFETILEEINQTDLGIRLLIGGFDGLTPRLMEISGGEVFIPPLNFHVIGEGSRALAI